MNTQKLLQLMTPRFARALDLMARQGMTFAEAAPHVYCAPSTLEKERDRIKEETGAKSIYQIIFFFAQHHTAIMRAVEAQERRSNLQNPCTVCKAAPGTTLHACAMTPEQQCNCCASCEGGCCNGTLNF